MDDLFKKKLSDLRNPAKAKTFGEDLLNPKDWPLRPIIKTEAKKVVIHEEYSEKVQVIESLGRFAQDKVNESNNPIIKIEGGEISIKPDAAWDDIPIAQDTEELMNFLTLPEETLESLIAHKKPHDIKILFVTESFHGADAALNPKDGFFKEVQFCFPAKTVEFFARMVGAMKIPSTSILLYPIEKDGEDLASEVMAIVSFFRPDVIVTLGAKAANRVLKSNDRLSTIQGQFFKRKVGEVGVFNIVPLFHPTIIETNPNMKKLTWEGMQKIMTFIQNPQ